MRNSSLTAETLSRWLHSSGTLSRGRVTDVQVNLEFETPISTLFFLTATYSSDAPADLPRHLVVKSPLSTPALSESNAELWFYRDLAPSLGTPPAARCLATIADESDSETIVLEDLRATHDHPPWPLPPSRMQCELALDALARLHARWWEAPTLGHSLGKPHTPESLKSMVQGISAHLPAFIDDVGDAFTAEARDVLERVFSSSLHHGCA